MDQLAQSGVLYHGLNVLGGGPTLAGIVLAAIAVFIIEREFLKATGFALAGAILTFFGLIHGEAIGIGSSPEVAVSYLGVAAILFGCAKFAVPAAKAIEMPHGHDIRAEPAE